MDENATKSIARCNADAIVLLGGGGHAKVVVSILRKLCGFNILGYTDLRNNGALLGVPYLGFDAELTKFAAEHEKLNAVLAVGQVGLGKARCSLWEKLQILALAFPPIISPSAIINENVSIGEGSVAMDGAVINSCARIGRGAIVNTNSVIEHDVVLDDWVHVAPGATVCGGVTVGRYSMIGAGATIIEGRQIATDCIVGAGATVIHDLTEPGVYAGCPARRIGS
jgi:sugar O-acyltransferase (sialic acid O-acetyltransferase NeuD family)